MEDHHVDRPDVEAWQRVKLTGTNRSFDLIALVAKARFGGQTTEVGGRTVFLASDPCPSRPKTQFCFYRTPEDGRQTTEELGSSVLCPPPSVVRSPSFAGLVALARRSDPIPSRTRPSNALAPMVLCLKTWESRSSPGLQRTEKPSSSTRQSPRRGVEQPGSSSGS